jgi:quercetin dioxygenase-like cupin family protein
MRHRFLLAMSTAVLGVVLVSGIVVATAPTGVTSTIFAIGHFHDIHAKTISGKSDSDDGARHGVQRWQARIDTKGESDLYVLENRIAPGGSFGWHSHPGPSLVIVKTGTLTVYMGDDPTCAPEVVQAGSGFVDDGGDIHLVRNEGTVETVVYVTSLIPRDAMRRIDEPSPGNCPF